MSDSCSPSTFVGCVVNRRHLKGHQTGRAARWPAGGGGRMLGRWPPAPSAPAALPRRSKHPMPPGWASVPSRAAPVPQVAAASQFSPSNTSVLQERPQQRRDACVSTPATVPLQQQEVAVGKSRRKMSNAQRHARRVIKKRCMKEFRFNGDGQSDTATSH